MSTSLLKVEGDKAMAPTSQKARPGRQKDLLLPRLAHQRGPRLLRRGHPEPRTGPWNCALR